AALAELRPGDAARLARLPEVLRQAGISHHEVGQQLVDRGVALDRQPFILGGALLAQVLFDLLAVADLGQMNRRGLIAVVTFEHKSRQPKRLRSILFRSWLSVNF